MLTKQEEHELLKVYHDYCYAGLMPMSYYEFLASVEGMFTKKIAVEHIERFGLSLQTFSKWQRAKWTMQDFFYLVVDYFNE